jgi:hypothetical protein
MLKQQMDNTTWLEGMVKHEFTEKSYYVADILESRRKKGCQ